MDNISKLRAFYGSLLELILSVERMSPIYMEKPFLDDYNYIYESIKECIPEVDLTHVDPSRIRKIDQGPNLGLPYRLHMVAKLRQLRGILEYGLNLNDKIVQIGSLFNSIKDEELRSRCGDLLTANGHFDRVVNQATQVLEARIQQKSGSTKSGKQLVNEVVKPDITSSILILSNNANEQEGYSNILRGLMQTLRNSSHHSLSTSYTREDAFAVCGFIDQLLRVIDRSSKKS